MNFNLKNLKNDIPASIVVFFVAVPLCLGIALASEAPPISGIIAGIIGGIVVATISKSTIGVSGPAAGLAAIVASAITDLGSFDIFLLAVVIAGVIQIIFGLLKLGIIGYFFPNSVIRGMLTGIGIYIILKQIPHFFGYDLEPMGADAFIEPSGENTFSAIIHIFGNVTLGSVIIGVVGLAILLLWDNVLKKKHLVFNIIQGSLVAVVLGVLYQFFLGDHPTFGISKEHLVNIPVIDSLEKAKSVLVFPDFTQILNGKVWITAATIAVVASLETLLSVEATDKLDPEKNVTPTNRELFAQGFGNMASGMIGGLPITQVIVRSSANVQSNAKSKFSAILHGFLLLIFVLLIPNTLNLIPNSVLAAILFIVGFKLAKPQLFKKIYNQGWTQFVPFIATVLIIIFKNLLWGISIGLVLGILVVLYKNYTNSHSIILEDENEDDKNRTVVKLTFSEEMTFLNRGNLVKELNELPENSVLELDVRKTRFLDHDIIEILEDFVIQAKNKNIEVHLKSERGNVTNPESYVEFFNKKKITI